MLAEDQSVIARTIDKRLIAGWAVASILLAVGAPFQTDAIPFLQRLYYWPTMVAIAIIYSAVLRSLLCREPLKDGLPTREVLVGVLFAVAYTPTIWLVTDPIFGLLDVRLEHLTRLFPEIMIVGIVTSVVRGYLRVFLDARVTVTVDDKPAYEHAPRLLDRIEGAAHAQVIRLTVNDHYVVVVLDDGRVERLLMRLRDAVSELHPVEGFYTHRSHWVNRAFITSVHREEGKDLLGMADGAKVPVSRTYRTALADAGLL